jgi:hypothetical protein
MDPNLALVPQTVGPRYPRHDGSAAGPDDDFMVLPDPSIGEVVSAGTNRTLRGFHKTSAGNRIALAILGLIFGGIAGFLVTRGGVALLLDLLDVEADPGLLGLVGFAGMAVASVVCAVAGFLLPLLFRAKMSSYVGRQGIMRYVKPKLGSARKEVLAFANAEELKVSRTRNYYNGAYTGTTYNYTWYKGGRPALSIAGMYRDDRNDPIDPVNFAFAAEKAWTRFRLAQVQEQMRQYGVVRFRAGNDFIGVGDGFIEIGWKGAVERLEKAAIASLSLAQGTLIVKRHGAKEGLFRSEGVFRFPVSTMSDFHTFLVALEVCTGYHFS